MCIRGKSQTSAVAASSSSTERVGSESHRVDEINLIEKFQSIGVGDPKRRWLVDSGATCHIISERWLSHYKVVYKYEVGIPVLKGAGDNVLPTRGMVDLECKVGQIKVIMRKVVICALDLNVLSSHSLHPGFISTASTYTRRLQIVCHTRQEFTDDLHLPHIIIQLVQKSTAYKYCKQLY